MEIWKKFFKEDKDFYGKRIWIVREEEEIDKNLPTTSEKCRLLAELIREGVEKYFKKGEHTIGLFCDWRVHPGRSILDEDFDTLLPEDKWEFSYKTPSSCDRCAATARMISGIFGSEKKFYSLPFVKKERRKIFFRFKDLKKIC